MLSIAFHSKDGQSHTSVEVGDEFYLWLAKSQFSKIGQSQQRVIPIEGEDVCLPVVELNSSNRQQLKAFFYEAVVQESDVLLTHWGEYPSKAVYDAETYRLRKLQELRKCIENEQYHYLERV